MRRKQDCNFQYLKNQTNNFLSLLSWLLFFYQSGWMVALLKRLFALSAYWDSRTPQISKWYSYIQSIAKYTGKMVGSLYCSRKYQTPLAMNHFTRVSSNEKLSTATISGLELPNLFFPTPKELKSIYIAYNYAARISLLYNYFYGKCSDEQNSLLPQVQTFIAKTPPAWHDWIILIFLVFH